MAGFEVGRGRVGPVRLAWADSSGPGAPGPLDLAGLGETQVRRHAALEGARAARFASGRWLLAGLIAELIPRSDVAFSSVCPRCGGDHGPPVAIDLPVSVSVSYAGSLVAVGAVHDRDAAALGIDLEPERPGAGGRLLDLAALFAPRDPPDLRGWTMIEAALKADGRGLRVPPAEVVLRAPESGGFGVDESRRTAASVLGGAAVRVSVPGRSDLIECAPGPGPAGFLLSVAVAARL